MAQRARGFNLNIIASDPVLSDEAIRERGAEPVGLDFLLRNADFVTVHTPLTPETRHLIGAAALAKMKPTAVLVNSARGPIVDLVALEAALRDGEIAHAALDVTDPEPIAADHPLLSLPNVTIVPHIGSASVRTRNQMAEIAAANLLAGLRGEPLPHAVSLS